MAKKIRLDVQQKNSFASSPELVDYVLKHNFKLGNDEINYIFNHIVCCKTKDRISPTYKNLCSSVQFLLKNLSDKQRDKLLELINSDFEFKTEFHTNPFVFNENSSDVFAGFSYECKNPLTSEGIITLANKMKHIKSKQNSICIKL